MFRLACLVIGYFIGCIQTAYFVGKAYHVDISKTGSGNLGTTNTVRALGIKVGLFTFWCDVAKSLAAFLICKAIFKTDPIVAGFYGSAGAIIGHDFPFFHKFKGGKGIATMVGMMFSTFPFPALIVFIIALTILLSGYVSVTSLALAVMIPIFLHIWGYPSEAVWVTIALALLAFFQHRQNIKRLISGTETRFDIIGKLMPKKKER